MRSTLKEFLKHVREMKLGTVTILVLLLIVKKDVLKTTNANFTTSMRESGVPCLNHVTKHAPLVFLETLTKSNLKVCCYVFPQ